MLPAAHVACPAPAQPKMWPALASSLACASHHPTSPHLTLVIVTLAVIYLMADNIASKNIQFMLIVVAYKIVYHVVCIELACVTPLSLGSDVLLFARCVHS